MKNNNYIYLALFLLLLVVVGYNVVNKEKAVDNNIAISVNDTVEEKLAFEFEEKSFDFGIIKQSGGKVSHDFEFVYKGEDPIKITGVPTSCACTSAKVSPTNLMPGDTGAVTIVFNPNLHAEPDGKFFKTAFLLTEPALSEEVELKMWAEIDLDLGEQAFELKSDHDDSEEESAQTNYTPVTAERLSEMLKQKDFTFIDVHIPEQEHIAGTDLFIPYNEIEHYEDSLPKNKDAKIVVYCGSGSMSRAASYVLAEHGYTNIYDLIGGKVAYDDFIDNR